MRIWFLGTFMILTALIMTNACMKLGPDFSRPELEIEIPDQYQHTPLAESMPYPQDQWWEVFHDRELNRLVEEVLKNNLELKKAEASIMELAYRTAQARAGRFPSFNLEGKVGRTRKTVEEPTLVMQGMSFSMETQTDQQNIDSSSLSLPATFELDLWGRLARAEEAARAELLAAKENRRTLAQTVVAETVTLYFQMESLERRIQITQQKIQSHRRSLDFIRGRYERGLASILELRQARRALAGAKASLPGLRQELGTTQHKLEVLLGHYPRTSPPRKLGQDYFHRLPPVPPGLPSDLLLRRPDVRAAEAKLKALNARVGEAKASRFPRIKLTGSYGYSSEELHHLFDPESELWSIAAGLVQPLFDAGKLKAAHRAAQAKYRQGLMDYAKTVLNAFSEVEGALLTRKEQLERRKRVLDLLQEARATQRVAEDRYRRGLTDYLSVLDARQARFDAEENLVLVDLTILANRVTLYRAFGGGWARPPKIKLENALGWPSFLGP